MGAWIESDNCSILQEYSTWPESLKQNASTNHISNSALDNYRFLQVPPHILTLLRKTIGSVKYRLQNANAKPQQLKESGLPSRNYCSLFHIILPWYCLNLLPWRTWNLINQLLFVQLYPDPAVPLDCRLCWAKESGRSRWDVDKCILVIERTSYGISWHFFDVMTCIMIIMRLMVSENKWTVGTMPVICYWLIIFGDAMIRQTIS